MTIEIDVGLILLLFPLYTLISLTQYRNLPFCDKQSLEDVDSYKDYLLKKKLTTPY